MLKAAFPDGQLRHRHPAQRAALNMIYKDGALAEMRRTARRQAFGTEFSKVTTTARAHLRFLILKVIPQVGQIVAQDVDSRHSA